MIGSSPSDKATSDSINKDVTAIAVAVKTPATMAEGKTRSRDRNANLVIKLINENLQL
ncbi:hypothetical protein D3C72_2047530 [compost metagenome]